MNCKSEFLNHLRQNGLTTSDILCVWIERENYYGGGNHPIYELTLGWTNEELNQFLESLDFDYDSGYGSQEVFGQIWYQNGSWSERGEYDGSEWWSFITRPKIPDNLNRIDKVREEKLNKIL